MSPCAPLNISAQRLLPVNLLPTQYRYRSSCSSSVILQPSPGITLYHHQTLLSHCSLLLLIYMNTLNSPCSSIVPNRTLLMILTLTVHQLFVLLPLNQLFINSRSFPSCSTVVSLSASGKRHCLKLFRNTERLYEPDSLYPQFKAGLLTKKSHIDSFQLGHT